MSLNVELLEKSFQLVAPRGEALVARFYERLFQKYPEVKPLFRHVPMKQQHKKLLGSLVLVIQNLRKPEVLTQALHQMGARHVGYGVEPGHYDAVTENLLAVLAEFAEEAWTPDVKQAWTEALDVIKAVMLEGAQQAEPRKLHGQKATRYGEGVSGMKQGIQIFQNWGIAAKLVALFTIFGLVPMVAVGFIAFNASQDMEASVGKQFQTTAQEIADKIDRNLFERYGDVQAFGYNDIIRQTAHWYDASGNSPISEVMNKYVSAYGIYFLTILVDANGKVIAVNSKDAAGNRIPTQAIYKKDFSQAPWFQALKSGRFTTRMPFTASGNDVSTGTFIEDLHIDPDVKLAYRGNDGLTLGFSAPVYGENGNVVAYWSNRTDFSLVEDVFADAYQGLKASGYPSAELTLLDNQGRVIVDYDPSKRGTEQVVRDLNVLMKLNLAEKGVSAAQKAVAGETGYENAFHARKEIMQAAGYAHLKGALGFPGMNWAVLARVPQVEAAAEANMLQRNVMIAGLVCLGLLLPVGWWVGRKGAGQVKVIQEAAGKMAEGDYQVRVQVRSNDEIGQLGQAFNRMAEEIQGNIAKQEESARTMAKANTEMVRIKAGLDNTSTNVLVCDRNYTIVYANQASVNTLRNLEHEIRKVMPAFDVNKVVGSSIDTYHKNPAHQRRLLDDPKNLPHHTEIQIGPLTLDLNAAAIMSESGEYLGNVVEWADVTAQLKAKQEVQKLIDAAGVGELSERIDASNFEGFFKVLAEGINKMLDAVVTPLKEAQEVLTALAKGDLTKEMTGTYHGEFEKIKDSLNTAVQNLVATVATVREGSANVSSAASEISQGNDDLSQRTSEQASALEETSASMEEMTSTIKQNADNAKQANQLATAAREVAEKGGAVTEQAVSAMDEINKSSKKIADIINVIDEIAFQTNLLALNAAVEAARAGEQGRGFAVVASEVRNLAQRSATAAKEIKTLINESVQKVSDGSELVNNSGKTLEEIVGSVKRVTDIIAEISAASQEQASGIDQVNKAIMQMDQTTQQNAALVEQAASASQSMQAQAAELQRQVEFFKVQHGGRGHTGLSRPAAGHVSTGGESTVSPIGSIQEQPVPSTPKQAEKPQELATLHSGNGHDRRQRDDDFFEEF